MVENQPLDRIETVPPADKKNEAQTNFEAITNKIKTPDALNRLNKNTLNSVDTYLDGNRDKAAETLFNIIEAMKTPNLGRKDSNSLLELQKICLKYTTPVDAGKYQLNKDIFNAKFDLGQLIKYGETFGKGSSNDWFKNITENYTPGANPAFDVLFKTGAFKDVQFTPAQLQKELYNRNTARINTLITDMKALTNDDISNLMAAAKITDIAHISQSSPVTATAIKDKFPTITDPYRELNYLLTKDSSIMAGWTTKINQAKEIKNKNTEAKQIQDNVNALPTTFTKDGILAKYLENNKNAKDGIYRFNSENPKNKLGDIVTTLTESLVKTPADTKTNELITLLKNGQFQEFQKKVYGETPTSKYETKRNDGKLGDETLGMVNTYLSPGDKKGPQQTMADAGKDKSPVTKPETKTPNKSKTDSKSGTPISENVTTQTSPDIATYQENVKNMGMALDHSLASLRSTYKEGDKEIIIQRIGGNIIKRDGDNVFSKYIETNGGTGTWENIPAFGADNLYAQVTAFETNYSKVFGTTKITPENIKNNKTAITKQQRNPSESTAYSRNVGPLPQF